MLFAVFFDIGQHGVRPDGVAFFRKVQVVPADAGEQFAGGTAEHQTLVLGSGTFIPGFEEQLSQLMAAERFDAEADMQVLERLLDTEGFSCGEKRS